MKIILTIFNIVCYMIILVSIYKPFLLIQQSHYSLCSLKKILVKQYFLDKENYILYLYLSTLLFENNSFSKFYCYLLIGLIIIGLIYIVIKYLKYKKEIIIPLKITKRIVRLFTLFSIFIIVSSIIVRNQTSLMYYKISSIYVNFIVIILYFSFIVSLFIEYIIYLHYRRFATRKLSNLDLVKIGITGSFGKTTTKTILYEILRRRYLTFKTEKSYNTLNGICMNINNKIKNYHEIAIFEMGASKKNDIEKIMKLTNPNYVVITAIGYSHLKSFKTINNIIKEKMKAVELLDERGVAVINIDNEYIRNYEIKSKCKVITIAINEEADYIARDISYSKEGLEFNVITKVDIYHIKTKLLGRHNVYNILLAIAMSKIFNIKKKDIIEGINNITPIDNRLCIKTDNDDIYLDDSYNSNYQGFINALEVLKDFSSEKTKILITPGIVENGDVGDKQNYDLAKFIKDSSDMVILIKNRSSRYIQKGLNDLNYENKVVVRNFKEAIKLTEKIRDKVMLIENDIPDIYK